jgi:hypothetical protein
MESVFFTAGHPLSSCNNELGSLGFDEVMEFEA